MAFHQMENERSTSLPQLTKLEWGVIVGFVAVFLGLIVTGEFRAIDEDRKDRILKEEEDSIMNCIKAKRWSAPNQDDLCRLADEKHEVSLREFGDNKVISSRGM